MSFLEILFISWVVLFSWLLQHLCVNAVRRMHTHFPNNSVHSSSCFKPGSNKVSKRISAGWRRWNKCNVNNSLIWVQIYYNQVLKMSKHMLYQLLSSLSYNNCNAFYKLIIILFFLSVKYLMSILSNECSSVKKIMKTMNIFWNVAEYNLY